MIVKMTNFRLDLTREGDQKMMAGRKSVGADIKASVNHVALFKFIILSKSDILYMNRLFI